MRHGTWPPTWRRCSSTSARWNRPCLSSPPQAQQGRQHSLLLPSRPRLRRPRKQQRTRRGDWFHGVMMTRMMRMGRGNQAQEAVESIGVVCVDRSRRATTVRAIGWKESQNRLSSSFAITCRYEWRLSRWCSEHVYKNVTGCMLVFVLGL